MVVSIDGVFREDIMKSIKSFLAAFYLLDQCYWIEQTDPLGMLLGMMNPEI